MYRKILTRIKKPMSCVLCKIKDKRVLAAHHVDGNHRNNHENNLSWLCHNCHHLVHRDNVEHDRFVRLFRKSNPVVPVV